MSPPLVSRRVSRLLRRRRPIRVGLVTVWFNRGQGTAQRIARRALDEAGYETYVLARPTMATARLTRADFVAEDDVWDQPLVTRASTHEIPAKEYVAWSRANRLDVVIFHNARDFEAIAALRASGVATAGFQVWENFLTSDVEPALAAYDTLYALNPWSTQRYADLGITSSVEVPFAVPPDEALTEAEPGGPTTFLFAGGFLSQRKPLGAVVDAFVAGAGPHTRLVVKTQRPIRPVDLTRPETVKQMRRDYADAADDPLTEPLETRDPRITTITDDLGSREHHELVSGADVLIGVSRWEGLGLHLYEAEPSGKLVLVNDMEPYTSFTATRGNVALSSSHVIGELREIPVHEPDVDSLAAVFARLSDPAAVAARPEPDHGARRWAEFRTGLSELVEQLS